MKFCNKCGKENPDSAGFCGTCGEKFVAASAASAQQQADSQPAPVNPVPPYPQPNPFARKPLIMANLSYERTPVNEMLMSPVLWVLAGLLTLVAIFQFIPLCSGNVGALIVMSPAVLGCIGLWMLCIQRFSYLGKQRSAPIACFTLFRASVIVSIVCSAVMIAFYLVLCILVCIPLNNDYTREWLWIPIVLFFLTVGFQALVIAYHVLGGRVITSIRNAVWIGRMEQPVSQGFIVLSFIFGICSVLSAVFFFVLSGMLSTSMQALEYSYGYDDPFSNFTNVLMGNLNLSLIMSGLGGLFSGGFSIMIAVVLSTWNNKFRQSQLTHAAQPETR